MADMLDRDLEAVDGESVGAWIKARLGGEFGAVTRQVPKGYEAYARVFHPARTVPGWTPVTWTEIAASSGATAHAEMQWHAIRGDWVGSDPLLGIMDSDTLGVLCGILTANTPDPSNCLFGLCVIQSSWDPVSWERSKSLLKLPMQRDHMVVAGPLTAVDRILLDSPGTSEPWGESPNLIWPADRSWLVASEVDFDSTLVGGGAGLIDAIVSCSELEAWQVEPTTSLAIDADKVNGAPS